MVEHWSHSKRNALSIVQQLYVVQRSSRGIPAALQLVGKLQNLYTLAKVVKDVPGFSMQAFKDRARTLYAEACCSLPSPALPCTAPAWCAALWYPFGSTPAYCSTALRRSSVAWRQCSAVGAAGRAGLNCAGGVLAQVGSALASSDRSGLRHICTDAMQASRPPVQYPCDTRMMPVRHPYDTVL